MASLLLALIYIAFISLGLPDSLLGSAWPVMHTALGVPLSFAGLIAMIISGGTIVSSLLSDRLTRKLGTGLVTAISVLMTAVALFGFSVAGSAYVLCLLAVPYGLGAGAVDAALNNYVANHFSSRHMSWLHSFWGVGAAASPYIMGYYLTNGLGWRMGYGTIAIIQITLTAILFASLPLWRHKRLNGVAQDANPPLKLSQVLQIPGVPFMLLTFFGYCALEATAGLWASSYLVRFRGINPEAAARFASFFYLGITFGRFLSGFITEKFGDRRMIRFGIATTFIGVMLILLPLGNTVALAGLIVVGLGCAPVYPAIIHSTPANFGKENSQAVIGVQMASAYVGSTFMPPLFGLLSGALHIGFYPVFLLFFVFLMVVCFEKLVKTVSPSA